MVFAELRDVDESVDITVEADECAEGCDLGDRTLDEVADLEAAVDEAPWVAFGLFDTEAIECSLSNIMCETDSIVLIQ